MPTPKTRSINLPPQTQFQEAYSSKPRISLSFSGSGRTQQSFKDECDINVIMSRYQSTGELPNLAQVDPRYLDATGYDYQEHQNFIAGANSLFHELPSAIRTRFGNSPAEFLDFCSQEKNRPELAEMGLLRPIVDPVIPNPQPVSQTALNASNSSSNQSGTIASGDRAASPGQ